MPDALGSLAAGGTLGILIPPSVNMIICGSMTNTSVGKRFIVGIIPGLLLSASFMRYIWVKATVRRDPIRHGVVPLAEKLAALREVTLPLVIFGMVTGTLYLGIATATESAAIGVVAALVLIAGSRKLSLELLTNCFLSSARTTGMILFVVRGIRPDRGGLEGVIRGALPYAVIMIRFTLLPIAFPQIVLWLPEKMLRPRRGPTCRAPPTSPPRPASPRRRRYRPRPPSVAAALERQSTPAIPPIEAVRATHDRRVGSAIRRR
jgi:TRAP-type C4-dicarboxylate transport system permease large subunit